MPRILPKAECKPLAVLAVALFLLVPTAVADGNVVSSTITVQVYADGSAYMTQHISARPTATTVSVRLLSSLLTGVVVTDQGGAPLEYALSGANITIYTLGATGVNLRYDTLNLTSKTGTVWTIEFSTDYNTTLTLPQQSTLTYVSGTPTTLQVQNGSPTATLSPGRWKVSYGVSIGPVTTQTTSTSSQPQGPFGGVPGGPATLVAVALILALVGASLFMLKRRGTQGGSAAGLRPDDAQVLNFISEKGGKVLEPEIRTRFALPKTSAWRQIKRLERLGYVKVTKVGSQNQIELVKKREQGA